jgi:hypothetical protein
MPAPGPAMDAAYRNYAGLLLLRHRLLLEGKDTDPETEGIERRLLDLWRGLDDEQRRGLTGTASDLNWVRREGRPAPGAKKADSVTSQDKQRLVEAEATKDWHSVLHSLRVCAPAIGQEDLARCRATAYALLGLPELADVFRRFADRWSGGSAVGG